MKLQALREQRSTVAAQMRALVDKQGAFSAEDQTSFDAMKAQIGQIDAQIKAIEDVLAVEASLAVGAEDTHSARGVSVENATEARREMLVAYLRDGRDGVNALLKSGRFQNAAQEVGTPAAGGYTVARELFGSILEAMSTWGGMRNVAQVIATDTGAALDFVTTNATAEVGRILAESGPVQPQNTAFGTATLTAFKYSSDSVAVSLELLQDSAFDIEAYIVKLLGLRLGRITNQHFTTGDGAGKPRGIVTASGAGKVGATGKATSLDIDDLIALEHSIDPVYRAAAKWMFHDGTLAKLKQLKDTTGRPLWLPGVGQGAPDTILGYGYQINQDMAQMAANAKSVLFGDLSKYLIRDVKGITLYRNTDSKYNELGQVGFHALMRTGGDMVDIGGAVKHYQNSAT